MITSKKVIIFSSFFATVGLIGTTSVLLSSCGETTNVETPPENNAPTNPNIPSMPNDGNTNNGNNNSNSNNNETITPDVNNGNNGNNGQGPEQKPNPNPESPETKPDVKPELNQIELTKLKSLPEDLDAINSYSDIKKDLLNFDNQKTWTLYNTDANNLSAQPMYIANSNDTIKLRMQMLYTQNENWNSYFTNNLNHIDGKIPLLTFKKNYTNDIETQFNNLITRAVSSVWSPNGDYMPRPYKQAFGGCSFIIPWITEGPIWPFATKNNHDLANTGDLFGPSDSDNITRVWNYYNVTKNSGIWVTNWNRISSPLQKTNKSDFINKVNDTILKSKLSYSNTMYKYDAFFYKVSDQDVYSTRINTGSGGTQLAQFRLFDNSMTDFQANGMAKRRSFDDWYKSNYWDYDFNLNVDNVLGHRNTINKVENIYLDFSKLLTIDTNSTSDYNVVDSSPIISFGLNLPLLSALREASNLALLVRSLYKHWSSIKSSAYFDLFSRLVNDIYNQKIGIKKAWEYIQNIKNAIPSKYPVDQISNDSSNTSTSNQAGYAKVLDDYNWSINTKSNINIDNLGWTIEKIVNDMSYWTLPYQYIIPQLFKNDIYVSYKINKINSEYTNDFKIYDGKTKTFNIINIFNGTVNNGNNTNNKLPSNLSSSNMTISLKDFVMKDPLNNNSIISKIDDANNNTLTAENIYNISNTGTTENKKISYNEDEKAIEISWSLSLNNNINQSKQAQQFDYLSKTMLFDKKQLVNINKEFVQN